MFEFKIISEIKKTFPWKLTVIFVLFSAAVVVGGILYYRSQKERIITEETANLAAIASLKIGQIESWRKERGGDAAVIRDNRPLIKTIRQFLSDNDKGLGKELTDWMKSVKNEYDYKNVLFADTSLRVRLSVNPSDYILGDSFKREMKSALNDHRIVLTDLHRSEEIPFIHLDVIIPLFDSVNKIYIPVGLVVLRIDPNKVLFPLIDSWPTSSKSSETLLIRRERDSVLYLNKLRLTENTALRLRLPLSNKDLLATKAAKGFIGTAEGVDYRNVPVVGSLNIVPGTQWFMVAKVDKEEILAPLKRYVFLIILIVTLLVLINASIFGFWIWQQRIKFYKNQLKIETVLVENEKRLREAQKMAHLGFWNWDIKSGDVEWSEEVYKIFHLDQKNFKPQIDSILSFSPWEEDNHRNTELINRAIKSHEPGDYEQKFLRPDNSIGYYYSTFQGKYDVNGNLIRIVGTVLDITERKLTESALRESEIRFRSLYENATLGIYRTTTDGKILMANPALASMLGFKSFEELAKRNLEKEGYEPDYPRKKFIETLEQQGRIIGLESVWHKRDGSLLHVRESAVAIRDDKGKILYFDGNVEDITERKKTEEALRESEDKFKYVFDHSVIGKSITFPTGEIHVNKALCDLLGYSEKELESKKWQDISHPEDIELTQKIMDSLIAGEKRTSRFIKRYIHKNSTVVWTDVGTAIRRDDDGKPLYFMTAIIDITERKKAEESLRLKNFVFDDSIAANSISDVNGNITEANAAFLRIWGYKTKDEVIGKPISHFLKDNSDSDIIVDALSKSGEWEGDYTALKNDGSTFIAHGLATRIKDEKGKTVGYQSAVLDVTESRKAEEIIHKLNEELEQKVMQRTALLEAANKELEAFSYSVSHDLRAPLRSVHGYTKILVEEYESMLDDEGKRICGIISSSATQMGELIDDLLNFSRIGRSSLYPMLLDMKSMVISVFADVTSAEEKSGTKLKIGKLNKAFGDANLIKLVWTNLISNAIKYSSKEIVPEIRVSSHLKYDRITYSVKDNGVGFDMNYKQKLFGVFQRLHSESEFEGNGVGLAIVQRIIMKHGGKVWAEGEVGKGATFYFSLPVMK